jgi:hypothetical protein
MRALPVLSAMPAARRCPQTGLSIPECCCTECCRALLGRYAPALLDPGPLDASCSVPTPVLCTVERYAEIHGISVAELRRRSSQIEMQV